MLNHADIVLKVLSEASQPLAIETIRKRANAGSWLGTKSILIELWAEGKINGVKTSKSWVFWTELKDQHSKQVVEVGENPVIASRLKEVVTK